jgi:hypothetical protein
MVCDYFSNDPPHDDLSVFSYNATDRSYTHVEVGKDSEPRSDKVTQSGTTWTALSEFPYKGKTMLDRVVFSFASPEKQTTKVEFSPDGGRTWTTVIETTGVKSAP